MDVLGLKHAGVMGSKIYVRSSQQEAILVPDGVQRSTTELSHTCLVWPDS